MTIEAFDRSRTLTRFVRFYLCPKERTRRNNSCGFPVCRVLKTTTRRISILITITSVLLVFVTVTNVDLVRVVVSVEYLRRHEVIRVNGVPLQTLYPNYRQYVVVAVNEAFMVDRFLYYLVAED